MLLRCAAPMYALSSEEWMMHYTSDGRVQTCSLCVAGSTARCIRDPTTLFSNPPSPSICCLELHIRRFLTADSPSTIGRETNLRECAPGPHYQDAFRGRFPILPEDSHRWQACTTRLRYEETVDGRSTRLLCKDDRSLPRSGCRESKGLNRRAAREGFPSCLRTAIPQQELRKPLLVVG